MTVRTSRLLARPWATANQACFLLTVALLPLWWNLALIRGTETRLHDTYTSVLAYASDGALLLTLATWPLARRQAPRRPFRWGPAAVLFLLGALAVLSLVSAVSAQDPRLSLAAGLRLVLLLTWYLYVVNQVDNLAPVLALLAAVVTGEGVLGLLQFASGSTYPAGQLLLGWGGDLAAAQSGASVVETDAGTRWLRAYGSFPHPNILGGFLAGTLLLLTGFYIRGVGRWTVPLLTALLAGAIGMVLTFSRGAWLAYALGVVVLIMLTLRDGGFSTGWRGRLGELAVGSVVVWMLLATLFGDLFYTRLADPGARLEHRSIAERLALRDYAVELLRVAPFAGVGAGNYAMAQLNMTGRRWPSEPVHSVPLLVWAETGPLGGLAWLGLLLSVVIATVRRRAHADVALAGITAGLIALLATGLVDHYIWTMAPMRTLLWLMLGFWAQGLRRPENLGAGGRPHDV